METWSLAAEPMPQGYFYSVAPVLDFHVESHWPSGTGMQFPGSDDEGPDLPRSPHVDAHLVCTPFGARYAGFETITYTVP
jgi:hypothetical protein